MRAHIAGVERCHDGIQEGGEALCTCVATDDRKQLDANATGFSCNDWAERMLEVALNVLF